MLSVQLRNWMAQSCEHSAKTQDVFCNSLSGPHSECLEPVPTYSYSTIVLVFY